MSHANELDAGAAIEITGEIKPEYQQVLTPDALAFVADLHRRFEAERQRVLGLRAERQARFDGGELPGFLPETQAVRDGDWTVGSIPADLTDRRVEITGPCDRKMVINALNCGANVFMVDFEDATSPTWDNQLSGQSNLMDMWAGRIDFTDPRNGKEYKLKSDRGVLIVRPRGWHLPEAHMKVDGAEVSGALFDFGLYFFHNAKASLDQGSGPYFYLPKLESHHEARLWNSVFEAAQEALGLPSGTIKATILIETLPAAFEMDEILYEMRDHIIGLNCGRWDYIFSYIKTLRNNPDYLLPDRGQVVMGKAFLGAYSRLLIRTCHRRGAFAMGGMAAQIPNRRDPEANEAALAKVTADKEREVSEGHDGTWVAHPDLVPIAKGVFDKHMPGPNQLGAAGDSRRGHPGRHARDPRGRTHRSGLARKHPGRRAVYRGMARRTRGGAALQSDGRRRDGGNLPIPDLAAIALRRRAGRRPQGDSRPVRGAARRRDGEAARRAGGGSL